MALKRPDWARIIDAAFALGFAWFFAHNMHVIDASVVYGFASALLLFATIGAIGKNKRFTLGALALATLAVMLGYLRQSQLNEDITMDHVLVGFGFGISLVSFTYHCVLSCVAKSISTSSPSAPGSAGCDT